MKPTAIIMGLAIVATTMFSCKKEYTCKCEKIYTDNGTTTKVDEGSYIFKDSETRADSQCNKQETTGSDIRGDYSRECYLD